MEGPHAGVLRLDEHVEPLARRDHQRICPVRMVEREPVLGDHLEVVAVQVHRVDHRSVVRHPDQHGVPLRRDDRRRGGEALRVQPVVEGTVAREQRVLHVPRRPSGWLDDEGAVQPLADLLGAVEVRVVDVGAGRILHGELVLVVLAGQRRILGDVGDAVHPEGDRQPVEVDRAGLRELVLEHEADTIAFVHTQLRAGDLPVVGHRGLRDAGSDLPLDLRGGELEDLHVVVELGPQRPVAGAGGLGGERLDALPMPVEHLLHRHAGVAGGGGRRGPAPGGSGRGGPVLGHHQHPDHAGVLVSGHRAPRLVVAGLQGGDLERGGLAGLKRGGLEGLAVRRHPERVRGGPVVAHRERQGRAGRGIDHLRGDREVGEGHRDRPRGAGHLDRRGPRGVPAVGAAAAGAGGKEQRRERGQESPAGSDVPAA